MYWTPTISGKTGGKNYLSLVYFSYRIPKTSAPTSSDPCRCTFKIIMHTGHHSTSQSVWTISLKPKNSNTPKIHQKLNCCHGCDCLYCGCLCCGHLFSICLCCGFVHHGCLYRGCLGRIFCLFVVILVVVVFIVFVVVIFLW